MRTLLTTAALVLTAAIARPQFLPGPSGPSNVSAQQAAAQGLVAGVVQGVDDLPNLTGLRDGALYVTQSYWDFGTTGTRFGRGGGVWLYDADASDTADNGTVLAGPGGTGRFFRVYTGPPSLDMYGLRNVPGNSTVASSNLTRLNSAYQRATVLATGGGHLNAAIDFGDGTDVNINDTWRLGRQYGSIGGFLQTSGAVRLVVEGAAGGASWTGKAVVHVEGVDVTGPGRVWVYDTLTASGNRPLVGVAFTRDSSINHSWSRIDGWIVRGAFDLAAMACIAAEEIDFTHVHLYAGDHEQRNSYALYIGNDFPSSADGGKWWPNGAAVSEAGTLAGVGNGYDESNTRIRFDGGHFTTDCAGGTNNWAVAIAGHAEDVTFEDCYTGIKPGGSTSAVFRSVRSRSGGQQNYRVRILNHRHESGGSADGNAALVRIEENSPGSDQWRIESSVAVSAIGEIIEIDGFAGSLSDWTVDQVANDNTMSNVALRLTGSVTLQRWDMRLGNQQIKVDGTNAFIRESTVRTRRYDWFSGTGSAVVGQVLTSGTVLVWTRGDWGSTTTFSGGVNGGPEVFLGSTAMGSGSAWGPSGAEAGMPMEGAINGGGRVDALRTGNVAGQRATVRADGTGVRLVHQSGETAPSWGTKLTLQSGGDGWLPSGQTATFRWGGSTWLLETVHYVTVTSTQDVASIAAGANATFDVTVTGAISGSRQPVTVTPPSNFSTQLIIRAWIQADNTVRVNVYNPTASSNDPASGTWVVAVRTAG